MEAQEFMDLYDSCWFQMEIFKKQLILSKSFDSSDQEIQETVQNPEIFRVPSILSRSMSDQLWPPKGFSMSPDSVLLTPKLQTIHSGKEICEEEESSTISIQPEITEVQEITPKKKPRNRRPKGKRNLSKSLSELEFEELKGFMDLGFVFSEEDKEDSSLVEIIPGLQRFGKKENQENDQLLKKNNNHGIMGENEIPVSRRPYLSEAWEVLEKQKKEEPLMNWRIPALNNEIDIKDTLKWWAHTVASTVR